MSSVIIRYGITLTLMHHLYYFGESLALIDILKESFQFKIRASQIEEDRIHIHT